MMILITFFIVLILELYGLIVNVDAIGLSDSSQIEYGFLQSVNIFHGSGNYVNVIVPSNITKIRVYMWGASGGCYEGNFGGSGAYVEGILSVLPEQQLQVLVGYGKFGGGGEGNCGSFDDGNCEGGGRSAIVSDSDDLVTAGGGGGAGSSSLGGPATSYLAGSKEAVGYQAILNITTAQIANMTTACLKLSDSQILGGGGGIAGGCTNGKRFSGGSAVSFNRTAGGGGGGGYYGGGGGSNGAGGGGSSYMENIQDIQNSESGGFPIFDENSGWIPRCSGQNSPYFDGEKCNMKSCSIEGRSGKIVITIDEQISESPTLAPVYFPTNLPSQISTVTPTLTPSETPTTASPTTLEPSYSPTILLTLSPNIESVERIYSNYSCLNLSSLGNVEYTGSSSSGESHFPSEAFDDTISTYWQSNLTDFPAWIRVTLPKAVGLDAYRVASIATIPQLGGQEIINWEFQGYDEVDDVWITLDKRQDIKPNYSINQYEIHRTLTNHSYLPNPLFASYRVIVYDNNGWKDDEQHQFKVLVNEIKLCQKKLYVVPDDNLLEKSKRTKEALLRLSLFIIGIMVVAGGWIYFRGGSNAQNSSTTSGNTKRRVDGAVYSAVHRERSDEPDEEESLNPKYIIGDDEDNDEDDLRTIELAKR